MNQDTFIEKYQNGERNFSNETIDCTSSIYGGTFKSVNFHNSVIRNAIFVDTDFRDSNFSNTKIQSSTFREVDFRDCNFVGANFVDTKLESVLLEGATYDPNSTIFPVGFEPKDYGAKIPVVDTPVPLLPSNTRSTVSKPVSTGQSKKPSKPIITQVNTFKVVLASLLSYGILGYLYVGQKWKALIIGILCLINFVIILYLGLEIGSNELLRNTETINFRVFLALIILFTHLPIISTVDTFFLAKKINKQQGINSWSFGFNFKSVYSTPKEKIGTKKLFASLLAFSLGFLGIHKFFLGANVAGSTMLILSLLVIPMPLMLLISWIEGIMYWYMTNDAFNSKYIQSRRFIF